ncbi:MAG TPA: hypothetical protein VG477_00160 [Thermoanaerobaculia bacterium]|nr:hypothetical protein [Thermoanaerobaculia bacterium]
MTTRRDLLKAVLGMSALAFADLRELRLGNLLPPGDPGVLLGVEEAERTATLLQVKLRWAPSGEILIGREAPAKLSVPFLAAGPPEEAPVRPRVFRVASSPRVRREALARHKGLRVVDWHPDLERFGAGQLNERFHRRFGRPMDEASWRGWMAVKIAAEVALRGGILQQLGDSAFDGHKGTQLRFGEDHHLIQPVYVVDARGKIVEDVAV